MLRHDATLITRCLLTMFGDTRVADAANLRQRYALMARCYVIY